MQESTSKNIFAHCSLLSFHTIFNRMSLYEFNALPESERLALVWECSTYLLRRHLGTCWLSLYAVDTFFVEVRYNTRQNQITACRSFRSTNTLEPYLAQIDLSALFLV